MNPNTTLAKQELFTAKLITTSYSTTARRRLTPAESFEHSLFSGSAPKGGFEREIPTIYNPGKKVIQLVECCFPIGCSHSSMS